MKGEKKENKPTTFTELAYFLCISFIYLKTSYAFQSCATSFAKLHCANLKYILHRRGWISSAERERGAEAPARRCPTGPRDCLGAQHEVQSSSFGTAREFSAAREEEAETPIARPLNSQQLCSPGPAPHRSASGGTRKQHHGARTWASRPGKKKKAQIKKPTNYR